MNFNYLNINSASRTSTSNSSTDFIISFNQTVKFKKLQLLSAVIPYTFYNVNSGNNVLRWTWNSILRTTTITPGSYTANTLASAINSAFQAINANLSVTFDSSTFKFTFTFSAAAPAVGVLNLSQSTMNDLIGYSPTASDTSSAGTQTSTQASQMNPINYLFINIDDCSRQIMNAGSALSFSFYLPINVNTGEIIAFNTSIESDQTVDLGGHDQAFSRVRIRITDDSGAVVDLNNNDWNMLLKLN